MLSKELCASLVAGLEDHLEELVHRLLGGDRPDDGLELGFVLSAQLDTVLLGQRLRELAAGEQTARDEDLAEASAFFALNGECTFELRLGQELEVDEEVAESAAMLAQARTGPERATSMPLPWERGGRRADRTERVRARTPRGSRC